MVEQLSSAAFEPDWALPPGATVDAILTARSLSRENLAASIGESVETVQRLLLGLQPVDERFADLLACSLGPSRRFWMTREAQYRQDAERARQCEATASRETWVKQFPVREMATLGWISDVRTPLHAADECLRFFDVPDVAAWKVRYSAAASAVAFRMTTSTTANSGAVTAWLRWAELVAGRIPCGHWDAPAFRQRLLTIRRLTWQKDPSSFLPSLRRLCSEVGVAVVVARTPKGCPASGATRFLSPNKAMMVLSFRYRADDQFWFTFFHEAAHLLLHGSNALFLEGESDVTSDEEREANEFAEKLLVPPEHAAEILSLALDHDSILRFARRVGISPGIVVGQLQHLGRVPLGRLNWLKRRYAWSQIQADRLIP